MSETVKLIIEIPESDYKAICENKEDAIIAHDTCRRIAHGIPLDDVKAEIENQIKRDLSYAETETLKVPCHYGIANGLQNAIRFLDNMTESEE